MWRRYAGYADLAYGTLVGNWYHPLDGSWDGLRFWQAANAMHAIVNYAAIRPVAGIVQMLRTIFHANAGDNFAIYAAQGVFDDEGWWALAWLAAYDLLKDSDVADERQTAADFLWMAKFIFNNMSSQWTWRCGGGCCWNTPDYAGGEAMRYKNAIVNELFFTLAVRLYQRTNDALYLDWAMSSLNWFKKSGMQNASGLINDGLRLVVCGNNGGQTYTYNQGVILGGLADMYLVTGDYSTYIEQAAWPLFQSVIASDLVRDCVLTEPAGPDDETPQFKGVFMRYLAYLCSVDPDPGGTHRPEYLTFIARNANAIWYDNRWYTFFGYSWAGPFDEFDALRQSAAFDALVAAIQLDSV
jgi:predicted alpha-1,6-mannanase (GH76 family)